MSDEHSPREALISRDELPLLRDLFQVGVEMDIGRGASLAEALTRDMGLAPEAVERIQTIFLNSSPVDDLERTVLQNGDVLALSAAMPGLMGAVMRRGGFYARLRESISAKARDCAEGEGPCRVRVKVFNLLLDELTPSLLARGVLVEAGRLADLPGLSALAESDAGAKVRLGLQENSQDGSN